MTDMESSERPSVAVSADAFSPLGVDALGDEIEEVACLSLAEDDDPLVLYSMKEANAPLSNPISFSLVVSRSLVAACT